MELWPTPSPYLFEQCVCRCQLWVKLRLCCAIGLCHAGMFATFFGMLGNATMDKNGFPLTVSCCLQTVHMAFCRQALFLVVGGSGTSGAECGRLVLRISKDFCGFARPNMPGGQPTDIGSAWRCGANSVLDRGSLESAPALGFPSCGGFGHANNDDPRCPFYGRARGQLDWALNHQTAG